MCASALQLLPIRQREAIVCRFYLDLSEEQTADTMRVAVGTVKSATSRGLQTLRVTLEAERNQIHGLNLVGLRRAKIPMEAVSELKRLFKLFYLAGLNGTQAIKEASQDGAFKTAEAREFIEFVRKSPNGICQKPSKT